MIARMGGGRAAWRLVGVGAVMTMLAGAGASRVVTAQEPVGERSLKRPRTWQIQGVEVLPVRGNVYMLAGAGANVTVQAGPEGLLLVDTGGPGDTTRVMAALHEVFPDARVRTIINTTSDSLPKYPCPEMMRVPPIWFRSGTARSMMAFSASSSA